LHVYLFDRVTNAEEILSKLLAGELNAALINPTMVYSLYVLQIAAHKALFSESYNSLATKSIHSELVYNLSGSRNMKDTFSKFGMQKNLDSVLVAVFDAGDVQIKEIFELIKGSELPLENLEKFTQEDIIRKTYSISTQEAKQGDKQNLERAILNAIALKGIS